MTSWLFHVPRSRLPRKRARSVVRRVPTPKGSSVIRTSSRITVDPLPRSRASVMIRQSYRRRVIPSSEFGSLPARNSAWALSSSLRILPRSTSTACPFRDRPSTGDQSRSAPMTRRTLWSSSSSRHRWSACGLSWSGGISPRGSIGDGPPVSVRDSASRRSRSHRSGRLGPAQSPQTRESGSCCRDANARATSTSTTWSTMPPIPAAVTLSSKSDCIRASFASKARNPTPTRSNVLPVAPRRCAPPRSRTGHPTANR